MKMLNRNGYLNDYLANSESEEVYENYIVEETNIL